MPDTARGWSRAGPCFYFQPRKVTLAPKITIRATTWPLTSLRSTKHLTSPEAACLPYLPTITASEKCSVRPSGVSATATRQTPTAPGLSKTLGLAPCPERNHCCVRARHPDRVRHHQPEPRTQPPGPHPFW